MLRDYINRLIRKKIIDKDVLTDHHSEYHAIKDSVKYPTLALFYLKAHYQYGESIQRIWTSYRLYLYLREKNIKIDISKFKPYNHVQFLNKMQHAFSLKFTIPQTILNDIPPFKILLADSAYVVIACLRLTNNNEYIDDFRIMRFYSSPSWCLKSQNHFKNYTTGKNAIQYVIIKKNAYTHYKEFNKLHELSRDNFSFDTRIGITLKRKKKLWAQTGPLSIFIKNAKITSHDDSNTSINTLNEFFDISNNFPIHKVHNKLIQFVNNNRSLDIPEPENSEMEISEIEHYLDRQQSAYRPRRERHGWGYRETF